MLSTTSSASALVAQGSPLLVTWLTPRERAIVAARLDSRIATKHVDTLEALRGILLDGHATAALVSAARVDARTAPGLAALKRAAPMLSFAGLISDDSGPLGEVGVLTFARLGVAPVADLRDGAGWRTLRAVLDPANVPPPFVHAAVTAVHRALGRTTDGWLRFIRAVFDHDVTTVQAAARHIGLSPSNLVSRFGRAELPAPREYLIWARIALAAHAAESPGRSMSAVAHMIHASSPQAMSRRIKGLTGLNTVEFRRTHDGPAALARMCAVLVAPYREVLRTFDPTRGRIYARAGRRVSHGQSVAAASGSREAHPASDQVRGVTE